ncbi:4-hydroxy-tetrahydrodipicolinate reductase [bacterium]|nr:4-hydroxy-tetrahydrodipicolinate reductase [bacterium]
MPNVVISGLMGRMGSMIARDFIRQGKVTLAGAVVAEHEIERARAFLDQMGAENVPVSSEVSHVLMKSRQIDTYLDFSVWDAVESNVPQVARKGIPAIIGASGFAEDDFDWMETLAKENDVPILLVPNFSIGILLVKKMSMIARKYFPTAELIETHHDLKRDAPSGTSLDIATSLAKIEPPPPVNVPVEELDMGSRGMAVRDVKIHSLRLPGVIAEQEIVFAGDGEVLTIKHSTTSRAAFLAGIYFAIDSISSLKGLTVGLDKIMDI